MPTDTRREELQTLRIDRSLRRNGHRAERGPRKNRYIVIGVAALVMLSSSVLAYRLLTPATAEVEVVRAAIEGGDSAGSTVLSATGYIVAHHKINVNTKVTGRVAWIGVEKGDKVRQGQVLIRLEDDEFRAQVRAAQGAVDDAEAFLQQLEHGSRAEEVQVAQHNLEEARATASNDKVVLDRDRQLFAVGVISKQALDDASSKYEADQERVDSLESTLRMVKVGYRPEEIARARGALRQAQGQLAFAESQLDATVIRAPVSGTVLERTAEKGELITAQFASQAQGGPVGYGVALADLNDLQVELDIAQDDFSKLGPSQKASITTDAYPDRQYTGEIAEISPEANRQKATVQVKVQILNPDSYLRPDMNATVKFLAGERTNVKPVSGVFVPTSAVRDRDGKKVVFIAWNGKALMREVRIVTQRRSGYLVEGLDGGENVVTTQPENLKDGQKIQIKAKP